VDGKNQTAMDDQNLVDNDADQNAGQLRASLARFAFVDHVLGKYAPGKVVKLMTFIICVCFLAVGAIIKYGDLLEAQWFVRGIESETPKSLFQLKNILVHSKPDWSALVPHVFRVGVRNIGSTSSHDHHLYMYYWHVRAKQNTAAISGRKFF